MSNFVSNSHYLREILLNYFISKETAAESNRILMKVFGRKPAKKFEDPELHALLDEDSTLILKQLAEALKDDQRTISSCLYMPLEKSRKKENGCHRTN